MNRNIFRYLFFILFTAVIFTSCKVTRPYQQPGIGSENLFRDAATTDTNTIANLHWKELFTDTSLQRLIAEGIAHNPDLQMAFMRIQQSRAYYLQSGAALLPSLDANTGITISKLSEVQGMGIRNSSTQYQLVLSSSWEADIWGKLRSSKRASFAALLQTEAASKTVQTGLVANIANFYFALLALDEQLAITQQTVANWDATVQTMRALKEAARVTEAAVVQSEAQRYAAEVTIPDLKQSIKETENALSILLGLPPSAIYRSKLQSQEVDPS